MNKNIEHKIEKTLQSIEGMEHAKVNPFLFGKIMSRMQTKRVEPIYNGKVVLRYAFLLLLLGGINFFTVYRSEKKTKEKLVAEAFASEYFITSKTFEY